MNRLSEFFRKESADKLGVFYPTNHIVAVFPTAVEAQRVKQELDSVIWIDGGQNRWIVADIDKADSGKTCEPDHHDRTEG